MGVVTATDFAFMSTSEERSVCEEFMDPKQRNVLWELECGPETAEGFHCGADVSILSQWPKEREILFLPMTMMKVKMDGEDRPAMTEEKTAKGATFSRICVRPTST